MATEWFLRIAGVERGPFSSHDLKQLAFEKKLTPESPVKKGTTGNWVPAGRVSGLFAVVANPSVPPPMPQTRPTVPELPKTFVRSVAEPTEPAPSRVAEPLVKIAGRTSYTVRNLMPCEKILYAAGIHPMIFLPCAIQVLLYLVGGTTLAYFLNQS